MRVCSVRSGAGILTRKLLQPARHLHFKTPVHRHQIELYIPRELAFYIHLFRHDGRIVDPATLDEIEEQDDWDAINSGLNVCESKTGLNVVLVHPQIPQNTGCTARTCAAASVPLHLIEPLGFDTTSRKLKRGGLDFWPYVVVKIHPSWQAFVEYFQSLDHPKRMIGFTKYGRRSFCGPDFNYSKGDWLIFGSEVSGLPPEAHEEIGQNGVLVKIPMEETHVRCLNLSVSVGIGLYEAKRQLEFSKDSSQDPSFLETIN